MLFLILTDLPIKFDRIHGQGVINFINFFQEGKPHFTLLIPSHWLCEGLISNVKERAGRSVRYLIKMIKAGQKSQTLDI